MEVRVFHQWWRTLSYSMNSISLLLDIEKSQKLLTVPGQDFISDFITYMTLYSKSALRSAEGQMLWKGATWFWICKGLTWHSRSINLPLQPTPACIFLSDWKVLTGCGTCWVRMSASVLVIWGHLLASAPTCFTTCKHCFTWKIATIPAIHSSHRMFPFIPSLLRNSNSKSLTH